MKAFISNVAALGLFFLYLCIIETSSRNQEAYQNSFVMENDVITVRIRQLRRSKRAASRKRGCRFDYNGTKTFIPRYHNYTDANIPCISWYCYRSGRVGLQRPGSGCPFQGRCIKVNPFDQIVEKTGIPCDERVCRIYWRRGLLRYGMVSPLLKAHCHYNGTCYDFGDVIDFPENCTTAVCDVQPRRERWIRRALWWPTGAGCSFEGQCYTNGTLFKFGECLEYMCNASVTATQKNKGKYILFNFQAIANMAPLVEGCVQRSGGCLKVNESYNASDCVTMQCVADGGDFKISVVEEGCRYKDMCVKVNTKSSQRCVSRTCKKQKVDNTLDYYFKKKRERGCPNHFNEDDKKCYKKGETMVSTEKYGLSKGCKGPVQWECDPNSKSIFPNCPAGT